MIGAPVFDAMNRTGLLVVPSEYEESVLHTGVSMKSVVMDGIAAAVPVNVQNVVEFIDGGHAPRLRDMAGVVSPWPSALFEYRSNAGFPAAMLVLSGFLEGDMARAFAAAYLDQMAGAVDGDTGEGCVPGDVPDAFFAHTGYLLMVVSGQVIGPVAQTHWIAHQDGRPVVDAAGRFVNPMHAPPGILRDAAKVIGWASRVVCMACALANCRNVALVEEVGLHPTRQARRAAQRRGDPPPAKFYTLRIDPNATRSGAASKTAARRDLPLHIVRGHFAHYTEDKPLFGKYAGTFWVPAHVRGSTELGLVGKDYAVAAPKGKAA